jgi:hypothetical protein
VTDFLIVLDAERAVLNNRDQLAQAQTDTATTLVSIYQGWWLGCAGCAVTACLGATPAASLVALRGLFHVLQGKYKSGFSRSG